MNPREFCREAGYNSTVLLTFNFDPLFFERIILPDLWAGGTGDVLVIADSSQTIEAAPRWCGQLRNLGRRYQLVTANVRGLFHPKAILRFGPATAAVWLGSGNLSSGGWGGNRELTSAWLAGTDLTDTGRWLVDFLDQLAGWCPGGLGHDVIARIQESTWYQTTSPLDSDAASPVLWSNGSLSLSDQLAARWEGRRFTNAVILTGSTDRNGAQLRWLHDTFGVEQCTIGLDQSRVEFQPKKIRNLPLDVDVRHLSGGAPIHAKMLWLEGADGTAAAVGSANSSTAAWLLAPDHGGNIETLCIYDNASEEEFLHLLNAVRSEDAVPAQLKQRQKGSPGNGEVPTKTVRVGEVAWEPNGREITVVFNEKIEAGVNVCLTLGSFTVPLETTDPSRRQWIGNEPRLSYDRETMFGKVIIIGADGIERVADVWVNDLAELRHATKGRHITDALRSLSRAGTSSDQNRVLADLHRISVALLSEPDSFPDPHFRSPADVGSPTDDTAVPIDPDQFIRSLNELDDEDHTSGRTNGRAYTLTLMGVMRALFELDSSEGDESEDEATLEPEAGSLEWDTAVSPTQDEPEVEPANDEAVSSKNRQRLRHQMGEFIEHLGDPSFAEFCTATQMTQAVAYPLAVAALGLKGGWVDREDACEWTVKIFDILFRQSFRILKVKGLLNATKTVYCREDQLSRFSQAVGDGTLWVALLTGLSRIPWTGTRGRFERALFLRAVYRNRDLLAASDSGRMSSLINRVEETASRETITDLAPKAARVLDKLEEDLSRRWDALLSEQLEARVSHQEDDLLWRSSGGWAEVRSPSTASRTSEIEAYLHTRADVRHVKADYWVNVTRAAESSSAIQKMLRALGALPEGLTN